MKKRNEYVIIGILFTTLLFVYIGFLFINKQSQNNTSIIEVRYKEEVILEIDINKDDIYTLKVDNGLMHIEVKDGYYRVFDVDCPDKICEKVGWVKKGDTITLIVCLPNNIALIQK